jgi:DNA polymerase (family X)
MTDQGITNAEIASLLNKIAALLVIKDANPFRIRSYRDAADTIRSRDEALAGIVGEQGKDALKALPDIGEGIASIIIEVVETGRSGLLDRLQGEISPATLFEKVPGIGKTLAQRIVEKLDIHNLEELEQAAHDGRLAELEGFGETKIRNIQVSLAGMLSAAAQRARREAEEGSPKAPAQPDVGTLLDVDRQYRRRADAGQLRKIAPKRFNPDRKAWLPILNTRRGDWDFTALFSNTALAHDLSKTDDWVVLYYERGDAKGQATVVTETKGPLEGKRVIRGREAECRRFYSETVRSLR